MPSKPYVYPPAGNIPSTWVLHGDGHWGPVTGGGGGLSDEIFIVKDTSAGDVVYTLPDPATLPTPNETVVNVKNWGGGVHELHIDPGVGLTIDGVSDGIRTKTNNQGYRFRWGPSIEEDPVDGWVCVETIFGGSEGGTSTGPPEGPPPGTLPCDGPYFDWMGDPEHLLTTLTEEDGTLVKPDLPYSLIAAIGFGGGGGGATGGGYSDHLTFGGGGAGGGGGARKIQVWNYGDFPSSIAYHVGRGGAGAPAWPIPLGPTNPEDGVGGEASYLGDIGSPLFFVGGGGGGGKGDSSPGNMAGAGGGGWDANGESAPYANGSGGLGGWGIGGSPQTATLYNANGSECGAGANGIFNTRDGTGTGSGGTNVGTDVGHAESGGGAGGGGSSIAGGTGAGSGGGSRYGAGGGGAGGLTYIGFEAPTMDAGHGGGGGTDPAAPQMGGGGAGGTYDGSAQSAAAARHGAAGVDGAAGTAGNPPKGGSGGGGGAGVVPGPPGAGPPGDTWDAGTNFGGNGGNGGFPGGGGGGAGTTQDNGVSPAATGTAGSGANGVIYIYVA